MVELILFSAVPCAIICLIVARAKGRSGVGWLFVGLLFSFFGVITLAMMPSLKKT